MNQAKYQLCLEHKGQHLQMVCMECLHNSLVCPECIDNYHQTHPMISLKKFITQEIPKLYNTKPNLKEIQTGINNIAGLYKNDFEKLRKMIGSQINLIQSFFDQQSERLLKQISVICGEGNHIYTIENIAAIKAKINSKQKIDDTPQFLKKIMGLEHKVNLTMIQTQKQICSIIHNLKSIWIQTQNYLLNSKSITKSYFAINNKHKDITLLKDNTLAQNGSYDNNYHIAVLERPITPFNTKVSFKIEQTENNCILLGVCHLDRVKQLNFVNCFKVGQGGYWLWQAGCEDGAQYFSHTPSNNPIIDWNFKIGDIVTVGIQFMQKHNYLYFQKGTDIFRAQLSVSGYLYPCVGLGDDKQCVSIVH